MPEWMDVDGTVKAVPIHIKTNDDMDMFLAMRVDLHTLKLYAVPLPHEMRLDLDGYEAVATLDEFSFCEVMSSTEVEKEKKRRAAKYAVDEVICSQTTPGKESDRGETPIGWMGNAYKTEGFESLSAALRHHKALCKAEREKEAAESMEEEATKSAEKGDTDRVTRLTRDLFSQFEQAAGKEIITVGDGEGSSSSGGRTKAITPSVNMMRGAIDVNIIKELRRRQLHEESPKVKSPKICAGTSNVTMVIPGIPLAAADVSVLDNKNIEGAEGIPCDVLDIDYEGDELFVGRVFKNREDCRLKMVVHAINRKFSYHNFRNTTDFIIARCMSEHCRWRVYAAKLEDSDFFQIKTAVLDHTCPVDVRNQFHRQASTSVISEIMKSKFEGTGRGPSATQLLHSLHDEHNINVSYWKAWRARELAVETMKGSASGSFGLIPAYLHLVEKSNVGSVTELQIEVGPNGETRFKYCFVAFGASVRGLKFMRKVLVIDETHLRGRYAGCLLTASAQDGNLQIFPVAFAVVDSENDKSWEWFFSVLKRVVGDGEGLTFVTDRHSSIYAGLSKVYPRSTHCACIVHLQRNVAARYKKGQLATYISKAARAYRKVAFFEHFAEIERVSPECADYLKGIGFTHWARSHCNGERYNIMTSNLAESLNAVLKDARELPVVSLLEYVRGTLMAWFTKRREKATAIDAPLTPAVDEMIQANFNRSTGYEVLKIHNSIFEVRTEAGVSFLVDLNGKTCTCEEFTLLKIPCSHAVAAALKNNTMVHHLAAPHYGTFFWSMAYSASVNPVPDLSTIENVPDAIVTLNVHPPATRRPPGRPKRCRYLSSGEYKRPRKKSNHNCTRCRGTGHNRVTCKVPI